MENTKELVNIVGVHATILSIFIAALLAFIIYSYEKIQNLEMSAIERAEQINQIYFARSSYSPKGFSELSDNGIEAIEAERSNLGIAEPAPEANYTNISVPHTAEDIKELFRYLGFLVNRFHESDDTYSIGGGKFIPRDFANRGEEILKVMNVLGHCYLFAEAPFESETMFRRGMLEKKYFKDISHLQGWLKDLNVFVEESKKVRSFLAVNKLASSSGEGGLPYLTALKQRDNKLIEQWNVSPFLRNYGHRDPSYLFNNFIENIKAVENIANDTQYQINRRDTITKGGLLRYAKYGLFWVGLLFLVSIIAPMFSPKTPRLLYIHFPLISYALIISTLIIFLWRKI